MKSGYTKLCDDLDLDYRAFPHLMNKVHDVIDTLPSKERDILEHAYFGNNNFTFSSRDDLQEEKDKVLHKVLLNIKLSIYPRR